MIQIKEKRKFGGPQPGAGRPAAPAGKKKETKCFRLSPEVLKKKPTGKLIDKLLKEHYGIKNT